MYILIIVGIFLVSFIIIYNSIISSKINASKSKSVIDVYLQQRFDLIPNLIEVTKGYMNYEKDILDRITKLRMAYKENKNDESVNELNREYNNIMATVENYPELKASEQFLKLQKTLIKIESQLQAARRIYNMDVTKYNTKISKFPNNIVATMFTLKELPLFTLENEDSEININVKF